MEDRVLLMNSIGGGGLGQCTLHSSDLKGVFFRSSPLGCVCVGLWHFKRYCFQKLDGIGSVTVCVRLMCMLISDRDVEMFAATPVGLDYFGIAIPHGAFVLPLHKNASVRSMVVPSGH